MIKNQTIFHQKYQGDVRRKRISTFSLHRKESRGNIEQYQIKHIN